MVTNTAGTTARELAFQAVHYLRRTVAFDTTGTSTGVSLGWLPSGAQILKNNIVVKTAFGGSGSTITVGTNSADYDNIHVLTTQDSETTANYVGTARAVLAITQDVEVFIKVVDGTTTAPTAGSAVVVLSFVPDNDQ